MSHCQKCRTWLGRSYTLPIDVPAGVNSDRLRISLCEGCICDLLEAFLLDLPAWKRRKWVEDLGKTP